MKRRKSRKPAGITRDRSLAGAEHRTSEHEQTEAAKRAGAPTIDDTDGFVTDAELEARERSARRRGR